MNVEREEEGPNFRRLHPSKPKPVRPLCSSLSFLFFVFPSLPSLHTHFCLFFFFILFFILACPNQIDHYFVSSWTYLIFSFSINLLWKYLTGQIQLSVILCLASEGENQLDSLPPHLQELIASFQLSPFIAKVSLCFLSSFSLCPALF